MAVIEEIELFAEVPRYDLRVPLGGRKYKIDVDWNGREGRWYIALSTDDGQPLAGSQKIVPNVPMFRRKAWDPRMPRGGYLIFLTLDDRASNAAPGWTDLARGVRLFWRDLSGG